MAMYTETELITKIKAIDAKLEESIASSRLDTSQTLHDFEIQVSELRKQRDYYTGMLQATGSTSTSPASVSFITRRRL